MCGRAHLSARLGLLVFEFAFLSCWSVLGLLRANELVMRIYGEFNVDANKNDSSNNIVNINR